jgi:hypothetical protein
MTADAADALAKGQFKDPGSWGAIAPLIAVSAGRSMLDMPWTQGLSDALDIVNGQSRDPVGDIEKLTAKQAASALPGAALWRSLARTVDNTIRDPQNPYEALLAETPFTQGMVQPRLTAFGQPARRPTIGAQALLNPFQPSAPTRDPVEIELRRLQTGGWNVEPGFVSKNMTVLGQPIELKDPQQRQYQILSGNLTKAMLDLVIPSQDYRNLSDKDKVKLIETFSNRTRDQVREQMEKQPELVTEAARQFILEQRRRAAVATPSATAEATSTPAALLPGVQRPALTPAPAVTPAGGGTRRAVLTPAARVTPVPAGPRQ